MRILAVVLGSALACWFLEAASARAECTQHDPAPPLCLTGTVTTADYAGALVEQAGSPGALWLQRGDTLLDWKVVAIGAGYVVLTGHGQQMRIDLAGNASPAPAPDAAEKQQAAAPATPTVKRGSIRRLHSWEARGEREAPQ